MIDLRETGLSCRDILARAGHAAKTVMLDRSDEPRKVTTAWNDHHFVRMTVRDRTASSTVLARHWSTATNVDLSASTVRRRLLRGGLAARLPLRRLPLSSNRKHLRRQWSRERRLWYGEWQNVVFSDGSRFNLSHRDRRIHVRRYHGDCNLAACIVERHNEHTPSVIARGAIGYNMHSRLLRIESNLNSNRYNREVLEPEVLPLLQATPHSIFQQDNARPHAARNVQAFFNERRVPLLPWPASLLDMSPIDHVWDMVGRRIVHHSSLATTFDALWTHIQTVWREISQENIKTPSADCGFTDFIAGLFLPQKSYGSTKLTLLWSTAGTKTLGMLDTCAACGQATTTCAREIPAKKWNVARSWAGELKDAPPAPFVCGNSRCVAGLTTIAAVHVSGTTRLPPTRTGFEFQWDRFRIFLSRNRAGRCRWSADFLEDLPFAPCLHSSAAPYSPRFTLIGFQDLDVKSGPNLCTPLIPFCNPIFPLGWPHVFLLMYQYNYQLKYKKVFFKKETRLGREPRARQHSPSDGFSSWDPRMEWRWNARAGGTASGIVEHDSQGSEPPGMEPGSPWWEASALATVPPLPHFVGRWRQRQFVVFHIQQIVALHGDTMVDGKASSRKIPCALLEAAAASLRTLGFAINQIRVQQMTVANRLESHVAVRCHTVLTFKAPAHLTIFPAFDSKKHGSDKGDTATHIKCAIAAERNDLKWRAVISSHCALLASHQGEPGSIPGCATPTFSQKGLVLDDAAGRRAFSGISGFPRSNLSTQHTNIFPFPQSSLFLISATISRSYRQFG
ncbi:hypothetical protein PR048_012324 [Dryococelus australis]|uniref:Transposase Tc1-like domain-containing protein n=1 Tax=Dryococelus australis TaxID=614101 RepID=A0ABQ9HPA2_9NEOP|nr:hypothetical protein PR048_012324 [Dryococelus australis]